MSWKTFCVFRHGQTDWNLEGRFQGHLDVPINATGEAQARALIPKLESAQIETVLSSDLMRARTTAEIVATDLKLPVFFDSRLREAHLGEAQGLTRDEIESRFGEEVVKRWRSIDISDADISYRGGESGRQVMERIFGAMEAFAVERPFKRIGISTHGGVIRRMMQRILPEGSEPVPIPNGILYLVEYHCQTKVWRLKT
jgi:probable phosphoglycerate mutase